MARGSGKNMQAHERLNRELFVGSMLAAVEEAGARGEAASVVRGRARQALGTGRARRHVRVPRNSCMYAWGFLLLHSISDAVFRGKMAAMTCSSVLRVHVRMS
jgi:hypothetical protein